MPLTLEQAKAFVTDFYSHYDPDNPKSLENCTGYFTDDRLIELLADIMADDTKLAEIGQRSFRHVNGFDKIVLCEDRDQGWKLRLHIWWPGATSIEGLHDHRWNFASHMITGMYYNWEYYQDLNLKPDDLTDGQKKVLRGLHRLEVRFAREERTALLQALRTYGGDSAGLETPAVLSGLHLSHERIIPLIDKTIRPATADENELLRRIQDTAQQRAHMRIDHIYTQIKTAKLLFINDPVSIAYKGGMAKLEELAGTQALCKALGVTVDDLKEFFPLYLKYDLSGIKQEVSSVTNTANYQGMAEMEGPHKSQRFAGDNDLQPIRPAHLLVIDPSLSGTTSTIILTERPRTKESQIFEEAPLRAVGGERRFPAMSPDKLHATLGQYRDFLIARKLMDEVLTSIGEYQEKPRHLRMRGEEEEAYYFETVFLPLIRECLQLNGGMIPPQGNAHLGGDILRALDQVLKRHPQTDQEAFAREMERNLLHHQQGHFSDARAAYYKGEQDALRLEARINQYARNNSLLEAFLSGCNHGISSQVCTALQDFSARQGQVTKEQMEMLWLLNERAKGKPNCQEWDQAFAKMAAAFIVQGAALSPPEKDWLKERIISDQIFGSAQQFLLSELDNAAVTAARKEGITTRNTAFWRTGELADITPNSEHLADSIGRYRFLAAHARLVSNFRELHSPTIQYTEHAASFMRGSGVMSASDPPLSSPATLAKGHKKSSSRSAV